MSDQNRRVWTADEVVALGVRTSVPVAGEIIAGLCRDESYRMAARGEFPVPVVRVGKNRLVVPVAAILELLRIQPGQEVPAPAPPGPAARGLALAPDSPASGAAALSTPLGKGRSTIRPAPGGV